jgi:hypothetical protein
VGNAGTLERPEVVPVPRKYAMDWLADPETGKVRPRYAEDYRIHSR